MRADLEKEMAQLRTMQHPQFCREEEKINERFRADLVAIEEHAKVSLLLFYILLLSESSRDSFPHLLDLPKMLSFSYAAAALCKILLLFTTSQSDA
ncbi:unnamed protein product [Gongylonema pulchrum]|uniref:Rab5-bind domain-containing protein n=1 Tax=Gongylonema pulchrum TaxID=637853 RepID=A0A183DQT8_9BILA|nr:unnamed protein product [Gongylonema pulchrum]